MLINDSNQLAEVLRVIIANLKRFIENKSFLIENL